MKRTLARLRAVPASGLSICGICACLLLAPSASFATPYFGLWGCADGAGCDTPPVTPDGKVVVSNLDIGQGFFLDGELTYFANANPGITTTLNAVAGVRLTKAKISYPNTNTAPAINAEFDLIYFEFPSPLTLNAAYTTIAEYDGTMGPNIAGFRSFDIRTYPWPPGGTGGGLTAVAVPPSSWPASAGPLPLTPISASASAPTPVYAPLPYSGSESMAVIARLSAVPGDVFEFPNSIEVGLFSIPEPSGVALFTGILLSGMACRIRQSRTSKNG